MRLARFSGIVAAIVWVIGTPLVAMSGVIPSDAQYFWIGTVAALLGLALGPVCAVIGRPLLTNTVRVLRTGGLAVCIGLILTGLLLLLAVNGNLGERAPGWITTASILAWVALFLWIGVSSIALKDASTMGQAAFWLGLLTTGSFIAVLVASIVFFYLLPGFVVTNATIVPILLIDLLIWISFPAWATIVVVRLRSKAA